MHHRRQEYLRRDFEVKNNELITNARKEMSSLQEISHNELYYLKTIIYALEVNFERDMKQYTNHKTAILEDYFTSVSFFLNAKFLFLIGFIFIIYGDHHY